MSDSSETTIRVRYAETDRMGLLHHANYFVYFEIGRTELLRQRGLTYREIEDAGHYLVIVDIGCKFKRPAHYDDLLVLKTSVVKVTHVRIVHSYQLYRDGFLLAEGHSTLAWVDRDGKPQPLPVQLRESAASAGDGMPRRPAQRPPAG
jgi:acyl-CoA thioester hydrolase